MKPQMFSFLLASVFIAVLGDYSRDGDRRAVWWLVPLMALWVNLHGGFALGLALVMLTLAGIVLDGLMRGQRWRTLPWHSLRRLGAVGVACALAVSLNPNGARMYAYPFETLTSGAMMAFIQEWFSPNFHQLMFLPLAVLIFATFAVMAVSKERVRLSDLLLLSATGYLALKSGRNIPFFALVAMPLLSEHAWHWLTDRSWGRWLIVPERREVGSNAVLQVVLNVALLLVMPVAVCVGKVSRVIASQPAAEARVNPTAAVDFIMARRPPGPLYNDYTWGGYLIWRLYPEYRVYIDGRADVYGDAFIGEFLTTHNGRKNWR
ncbi:MAG: hypothetical protein ACRD68_19045, partial [Pyrinomonadaceae bacterium]